MPIGITGKRIIVAGGARGIAAGAVRVFAREGAHVVSLDRLVDEGRQVAEAATAEGPGKVDFLEVDLTKRADVVAVVDEAVKLLGGIDAVFNIAAIERTAKAHEIGEAGWNEMLSINVGGVVSMCEAIFPHMKAGGGGAIINFSSDAANQPYLNGAHYSASKAAVISYTRTLAHEWGRFNIRANCVMPLAWTPMFDERRARFKTPEELAAYDARIASLIPLGRMGDPESDLAPALVFLASDAARYISAQNLGVNGGSAWGR
ncbi:SDR family NAD(P)-dependent oxidoreductase [Sphingomonas crocodyli]|uniref:SDR family oxidoreductase n=1 Tax=Sphingomonas crocodyli TaxID=1979270 RepID=A0A437LWI7_9SPHN|nr:SDR family oxidoreductase [Sphingomonas crocodyli]RVT89736.1 SDR family oxidoreductase [Sphingomonas crocodyli]